LLYSDRVSRLRVQTTVVLGLVLRTKAPRLVCETEERKSGMRVCKTDSKHDHFPSVSRFLAHEAKRVRRGLCKRTFFLILIANISMLVRL